VRAQLAGVATSQRRDLPPPEGLGDPGRTHAAFHSGLMSRHAWREAQREKMDIETTAATYEDPDDTRGSDHDDLREIRTRWFGNDGIVVVVDINDGRVVTVWRKG
jgi:hypothetical protein